jgi:hypothetical protein
VYEVNYQKAILNSKNMLNQSESFDTIPSTEAHLFETEKKSESIRALPEHYQYVQR